MQKVVLDQIGRSETISDLRVVQVVNFRRYLRVDIKVVSKRASIIINLNLNRTIIECYLLKYFRQGITGRHRAVDLFVARYLTVVVA